MGKHWVLLFLSATCLLSAIGQVASARAPSTPEERSRFVAIAHKLESNPLDASLRPEREWALMWLIKAPDVHVSVCSSVLGDYFKYKYSSELTVQLSFSEGAFSIEYPDKAGDQIAQYVAGVEGALKAYSAILRRNRRRDSKCWMTFCKSRLTGSLEHLSKMQPRKVARSES